MDNLRPANAAPSLPTTSSVDIITEELSINDLNDLCDATDAAIKGGGGFGWLDLPARDILERYWQGVVAMPRRTLLVARLDGVICGTGQLIGVPQQNEAQRHTMQFTTHFLSPWARGHGLARKLLLEAEKQAVKQGCSVINLDVRETQSAAVSLYESCGYIRYGVHPFYAKIDGKNIQGFHYTKNLDSASA